MFGLFATKKSTSVGDEVFPRPKATATGDSAETAALNYKIRGKDLYDSFEYGMCLATMKPLLRSAPDSDVAAIVGASYLQIGQLTKARRYLTESINVRPSQFSLSSRAVVHAELGAEREARADVQAAKELGTKTPTLSIAESRTLFRLGDVAKAYQKVCRIVTFYPTNADARNLQAEICTSISGKSVEACNASLTAVELNSKSPYLLASRAIVLLASVEAQTGPDFVYSAKQFAERSLQIAPDNLFGRIAQASILLYEKKSTQALQLARAALQSEPNYVRGNYIFTQGLLRAGHLDEAGRNVASYMENFPKNVNTWRLAGDYFEARGRLDVSLLALKRLDTLFPCDCPTLVRISALVWQFDGPQQGDQWLQKALDLDSQNKWALLQKCKFYSWQQNWAGALAYGILALRQEQALLPALFEVAYALHRLKRHADCLQICDKILEQEPVDFDGHTRETALLLRASSKKQLALTKSAIEDLLSISPDVEEAEQALPLIEECREILHCLSSGIRQSATPQELETALRDGNDYELLRTIEWREQRGEASLHDLGLKAKCLFKMGAASAAESVLRKASETYTARNETEQLFVEAIRDTIKRQRQSWWRVFVATCQDTFMIGLGTAHGARIASAVLSTV